LGIPVVNEPKPSGDEIAITHSDRLCINHCRQFNPSYNSGMTIAQLETRVATLEQKLVDLAEKVDASPSQDVNAWIDQIHGTFQNDSTYRQAARFGRQWRQSHGKPGAARPRKASGK
jgi:hypothetical protein